MGVMLSIGPRDHGRPLTFDEFRNARYGEGYQYELIDGKLYVAPAAGLPQNSLEEWLGEELRAYRRARPEVINFVTSKPRVFLPGEGVVTAPEPDLAAYHDFPVHVPLEDRDWAEVSPVLVAEVVSEGDPEKDLVRNVGLYLRVPSIREYWILKPAPSASRPTLLVHRRRGERWQRVIEVGPGETYTTRLLPGFALVIDPTLR